VGRRPSLIVIIPLFEMLSATSCEERDPPYKNAGRASVSPLCSDRAWETSVDAPSPWTQPWTARRIRSA